MTTILSPVPKLQFFTAAGVPLTGGKLYTYAAGTSSPLATYIDSTGSTPNTNPIILDSRGEANVWLDDNSYKFKLTDSNDVEIWTVDNISDISALTTLAGSGGSALVGFIQAGAGAVATTVQARLRQALSVKDFGATGDASTDDTTAIQNALNAASGRALYFPAGTYRVSATLVVKTKTTMMGDGINKSILKLTSGMSASAQMIRNDIVTGTADVYYDTDLEFYGLTFDGNNNATRTSELITILKVLNATFTGCAIQNNTFIGLATSASRNVVVTQCLFTNNGRPIPSTTSGPAFWTATTVQGTPYDIRLENNYFYDNNWSAAYFMPVRGSFTNNNCVDNGESTIFSNDTGRFLRIENNTITGARRSNISASGIECGAPYTIITGNSIESCDGDGISLSDVQNVTVSNNLIFNNGQDTGFYPFANGITIIGSVASPAQPDHIQIHGNRIGDRQAVKTQYAAIGFGGGGAACTNIAIYNNDFTEQKTATFYSLVEARFGTGCYTLNNYDRVAALQPPCRYATFTLNASAGAQSITGIGFRPRAIRITAALASTTQAYTSVGVHATNAGSVIYSAVDAAGRRSGQTTGIVNLLDSAGLTIAAANLTSYDVDGFTLDVLTGNTSCVCNVECFP
jgi:parallel beta-helix repeat protein